MGSTFSGNLVSSSEGIAISPRHNTQRAYTLSLKLDQTIFNFAQYAALANAIALSKEACAQLNASLQDLMVRVVQAYFTVIKAQAIMIYTEASKIAYSEQADQVTKLYKLGLQTITNVDAARASYHASMSAYLAAQINYHNSVQNLRAITGIFYTHLSRLTDNFPLVSPDPANVSKWETVTLQQNWSIKAAQYAVDAARETIKQQYAGHLPTLSLEASLQRIYAFNINNAISIDQTQGVGTQNNRSVMLNLNVPIFSGGRVTAQTKQAMYDFDTAQQVLEEVVRKALNDTEQSFEAVSLGISQIKEDKEAVKYYLSSYKGMQAGFRMGTVTLIDVLYQLQKLLDAEIQHANNIYDYIINLVILKKSAGTLKFEDIKLLNQWLTDLPFQKINKLAIKKIVYGSTTGTVKSNTHKKN